MANPKKGKSLEMQEIATTAEFVWSQRPSKYIASNTGRSPEERMSHSSVQIDKLVYIFGGTKGGEGDAAGKRRNAKCWNNLYTYDMESRAFKVPEVSGQSPPGRLLHTAVVDPNSGNMYVFGGKYGGEALHCLRTRSEPMQWDEVKTRGPQPKERHGHLCCVYEGKMLIIGGRNNKNNAALQDMYSLNLSNSFWEVAKPGGDGPVDTMLYSGEVVGNCLYLVGTDFRDNFDNVLYLDLDSLTWHEKKAKGTAPHAISRMATCVYNDNQIIVVGGKQTGANNSIQPVMSVHVLTVDSKKLQWEEIRISGRVPPARYGHTLNTYGTNLFMFGGQSGSAINNDMHILIHQMWKKVSVQNNDQAPSARLGATCAVVGKAVYVIGGAVNGHSKNDVFIWHSDTQIWESPSMYGLPPTALTGHCCAVIGTEIFIYGGGDGETPINDMYVIDTASHKWIKPQAEGTRPQGGIGCTMVAYGLKIIIYGGYGDRAYSGDVCVLDTATMTWSHPPQRGDPLPVPRVGHTAAMIGKHDMFVFGGSNDGKALKETWCLDVRSTHWERYTNKFQLNEQIYARFGHTAVAVGRNMYVFGGSVREPRQGGGSQPFDFRNAVNNDLWVMTPSRTDTAAEWSKPVLSKRERELPPARYRHVMVHLDGKIMVLTGSHGGKTVWVLDTGHYEDPALAVQSSLEQSRAVRDDAEKQKEEEEEDNVDEQTKLMLKFLQDLGLSKYNRVFLKQEVDWPTLLQCNNQDLIDMGVKAIGPRKKILKKLSKLNASDLIDKDAVVGKSGPQSKPQLFMGRYELESDVGSASGASASSVLFARDIRTRREVVLKFVRDDDEFNKEITWLNKLGRTDKMCVVRVVDFEDKELRRQKRQVKRQQQMMAEMEDGVNLNGDGRRASAEVPEGGEEKGEEEGEEKKDQPLFVPGTEIPLWDHYRAFSVPGFHWMALERGSMTLRDFFNNNGVIHETQRKAIFERILVILSHLHENGVVHVDVKPDNLVFFGSEMKLKLIDFGLAVRDGTHIEPCASPSYCSPEMAKAWVRAKDGDQSSTMTAKTPMDIWAAGMILFESYVGHPVLAGREDVYGLLAGDEEWIKGLPWGLVDNVQAKHLLEKILVKRASRRPTASKLLTSPYLTWGLDTVQINQTFGALTENCKKLKEQLEAVEKDAKALKEV